MASLPDPHTDGPTVRAIYASYALKSEKPRRYLGASVIGKPCERALWYELRWAGREEFSGRMLRLFQSGHLEEIRLIHNLRDIGVTVHDRDPDTGEQWAVSALGGHFRGHMDAACVGLPEAPQTWHVCEFKTHSAKSFAALKSKGVADAKPEHFAQMQVYMHLTGMERAVYLAVNKDTDELYAERLNYDRDAATALMERAEGIIESADTPPRISQDPDYYLCKFCAHRNLCHGLDESRAVPAGVNCRTCIHATAVIDDGDGCDWACNRHRKHLGEQEQGRGCPDHLFLMGLIPWAKVDDAGENWIRYDAGDYTFVNGSGAKDWGSKELAAVPRAALSLPVIRQARDTLGARVVADKDIPF